MTWIPWLNRPRDDDYKKMLHEMNLMGRPGGQMANSVRVQSGQIASIDGN